MNRDMQVGLALAILLIGIVGALCLRNDVGHDQQPLPGSTEELDSPGSPTNSRPSTTMRSNGRAAPAVGPIGALQAQSGAAPDVKEKGFHRLDHCCRADGAGTTAARRSTYSTSVRRANGGHVRQCGPLPPTSSHTCGRPSLRFIAACGLATPLHTQREGDEAEASK